MSPVSPTTPDVPSHLDVPPGAFASAVLEESRRRLVVVDFWAPWCAPCRMLGPVLEKLAGEARGGWLLAKVNVDEDQEPAARYGVQGIPAVKAFRDGEQVAEFVGALPEPQVRRWLEALVPGPADEALAEARARLAAGDAAAARAALGRALELKPGHGGALVSLAELEASEGRRTEAAELLERLSPADVDKHADRVARLRLQASAPAEGVAELRRQVEAQPAEPAPRLALARALAAGGDVPAALEELLELVRQFRRAEPGDEARRTMLQLFELVGPRSDLADEYRTRLSRELFR